MSAVMERERPTVDEIVTDLRDHVWQLLRTGHVEAAMVLLGHRVDDYLEARKREGNALVKWEPLCPDVPTMSIPLRVPIAMPAGPVGKANNVIHVEPQRVTLKVPFRPPLAIDVDKPVNVTPPVKVASEIG